MSVPLDAVVIGGGVVGTACAWRLAQRGRRVALVDPEPGSGASFAAAGMLAPVSELRHGESGLLRLNLLALASYPAFVADVESDSGVAAGFRDCGTLLVALDAGDRARLADVRRAQERLGLDVRALTGRECRRLEPLLDPAVAGGTLVPGDHQVDPRRLLRALRAAASARGVQHVASRAEVLTAAGRAVGAALPDGSSLRADLVVLATGAHAHPHAPVRPVKGQVLRLRGPHHAPVVGRTVRGVVRDRDVYLVPRLDGELVVGATSEDRGFDRTVTAGAVHDLLRDAQALVPGVAELELVEATARSRPGSPDNLPLVGRGALPGLLLAVGHHRNGVLLAGLTAGAIAALAAGEAVAPEVGVCDPGRFALPGGRGSSVGFVGAHAGAR